LDNRKEKEIIELRNDLGKVNKVPSDHDTIVLRKEQFVDLEIKKQELLNANNKLMKEKKDLDIIVEQFSQQNRNLYKEIQTLKGANQKGTNQKGKKKDNMAPMSPISESSIKSDEIREKNLEIEKLKRELQNEKTTKQHVLELAATLSSSITLSKHLLDNIKEPPIVNQVQQQPRRDSISGFDQSRQPLNEQLLNQEKKSNIDEDVLLQAQSKIQQLEKELAQSKAHVNNTNTTINTPAKPQVK